MYHLQKCSYGKLTNAYQNYLQKKKNKPKTKKLSVFASLPFI